MPTRLVLYEGIIQNYIFSHAAQLVADTAWAVEREAIVMVPKRTGRLAGSIHTTKPEVSNLKVSVKVGSDLDYAQAVHEGQAPHTIRAEPGHVLNLGRDGFATYVHHPGTHGVKYLTEPLERVGRRIGFLVTIADIPD